MAKDKGGYDTPAANVGNMVADGDAFVLVVKGPKANRLKIYSSGNGALTDGLLEQAVQQEKEARA